MATETIMPPVLPGGILLGEFLKPLSVSQYRLTKEIGVPARRISETMLGQRRHGAASGPVLRDLGAVLDEPADWLRPGDRGGPARDGP